MNFCPNFLCFLMICNVPQRSSFVICEGKENVRKNVFYNFFQFNRNPPTQIEILKFKMAFSIKNIEIGNLTRWYKIIATSQLTRLTSSKTYPLFYPVAKRQNPLKKWEKLRNFHTPFVTRSSIWPENWHELAQRPFT